MQQFLLLLLSIKDFVFELTDDSYYFGSILLEHIIQLISRVGVLGVVRDPGVAGNDRVLGADVEGVVDLPVDIADFSSRVKQALKKNRRSLGNRK